MVIGVLWAISCESCSQNTFLINLFLYSNHTFIGIDSQTFFFPSFLLQTFNKIPLYFCFPNIRNMSRIFFLLCAIWCASLLYGQEVIHSLPYYIEAAQTNSPLIQDCLNQKEIQKQELMRLKALYTRSILELNGALPNNRTCICYKSNKMPTATKEQLRANPTGPIWSIWTFFAA